MKIRNDVETGDLKATGQVQYGLQFLNMNDAQVALVLGTPGAGQAKLTGSRIVADAQSSATEKLLLPALTTADAGFELRVFNVGGESILIRDSADGAVQTLAAGRSCDLIYTGSSWGVFLAAAS